MNQNETTPEETPEAATDETASPESPMNPTEASESDEVSSLRDELSQAQADRDANLEKWQRSLAELDNYRKRQQKEFDLERMYRVLPVARELLPVLDNLQRALQAARTKPEFDQLLAGVEQIAKQFEDSLIKLSLQPIDAIGQPFDPNLHEAITQIPSADYPPMTVIQVVEQGYTLHERVVRPSKVVVSAAPPE